MSKGIDMKIGISALLIVVLGIVGSNTANATLVDFNETVEGDLGALDRSFVLDMVGLNTWSGTAGRSPMAIDDDGFSIRLDPSLQIVSYNVILSNNSQTGVGTSELVGRIRLSEGLDHLQENSINLVTGETTSGDLAPLPLTIATLFVRAQNPSIGPPAGLTGSYDWRVEIVTAAVVPLPAAAWLFISGLAGLIGFKRFKAA